MTLALVPRRNKSAKTGCARLFCSMEETHAVFSVRTRATVLVVDFVQTFRLRLSSPSLILFFLRVLIMNGSLNFLTLIPYSTIFLLWFVSIEGWFLDI